MSSHGVSGGFTKIATDTATTTKNAPMEWAADAGQLVHKELTEGARLSEDEGHGQAPHIQHRVQASFAQELLAGETRYERARHHGVSRNLIRI